MKNTENKIPQDNLLQSNVNTEDNNQSYDPPADNDDIDLIGADINIFTQNPLTTEDIFFILFQSNG